MFSLLLLNLRYFEEIETRGESEVRQSDPRILKFRFEMRRKHFGATFFNAID
jgi:hypothetical protein